MRAAALGVSPHGTSDQGWPGCVRGCGSVDGTETQVRDLARLHHVQRCEAQAAPNRNEHAHVQAARNGMRPPGVICVRARCLTYAP